MIGLGPHEMTAWLWAFSVGLTVLSAVLTACRSTSRSSSSSASTAGWQSMTSVALEP